MCFGLFQSVHCFAGFKVKCAWILFATLQNLLFGTWILWEVCKLVSQRTRCMYKSSADALEKSSDLQFAVLFLIY